MKVFLLMYVEYYDSVDIVSVYRTNAAASAARQKSLTDGFITLDGGEIKPLHGGRNIAEDLLIEEYELRD